MKKKLLLPLCMGALLAGCGSQESQPEELTYWDNIAAISTWQDIDIKVNSTIDLNGTINDLSETNLKSAGAIIDGNIQLDKETMTGKVDLNVGFPETFREALAKDESLSHIVLPESIDLSMYITPENILIPKNLYSMATTVLLGLPIDLDVIPFDYVAVDLAETGIKFTIPTAAGLSAEEQVKYSEMQEKFGLEITSSNEGKTFNINLDKAKITDLIVKFGQSFETQEQFENFLNTLKITYSPEEAPKMYEILKDEEGIKNTFETTIDNLMLDYKVNFEPEQYVIDTTLELSDAETEMKAVVNATTKKAELGELTPEEGAVIMSMDEATAAFMSALMSQSGL